MKKGKITNGTEIIKKALIFLSMRELAEVTGTTLNTMHRWAHGGNAPLAKYEASFHRIPRRIARKLEDQQWAKLGKHVYDSFPRPIVE